MKISRAARAEAKSLLRLCRTEQGLDEARLRKGVQTVAKQRPRGYLHLLWGKKFCD